MEAEDGALKLRSHVVVPLHDTSVTLRQSFLASQTGGGLWDSAMVMNDVLVQRFPCKGLRVLELGSGIGACAVQAAALGAVNVVATDADPVVLDLLRLNCAAFDTIVVQPLVWGDESAAPHGRGAFDLLLASDVIFDADQHDALLRTIARIDAARMLLCVRKRDPEAEQGFVRRLLAEQPWLLESVIRARDLAPASRCPTLHRAGCSVYVFARRLN